MKHKGILVASLCFSAMAMTFLVGASKQIHAAETPVSIPGDPNAGQGKAAYIPLDEYYSANQNISFDHVGNIETVWDTFKGDNVRVAIIDSGFDFDHPDFTDDNGRNCFCLDDGKFFAHGTAVSGVAGAFTLTGNVYDPIQTFVPQAVGYGYKFDGTWYTHYDMLKPMPGYGNKYTKHGTDVASTIASANHQTSHLGTTGVAPHVEIVPFKTDWTTDCVYNALVAVRDLNNSSNASKHIDVVNISMEGPDYSQYSSIINTLTNQGTIVVAAAGNSSTSEPNYPASTPKVIGVGALDRDSSTSLASYSNFNASGNTSSSNNNVDIVAPGHVYTASWDSSTGDHIYSETHGTSFASPIVAGAAALWKQANPNGTVQEFKNDLFNSSIDIGSSGWDTTFGYGRLDIGKLISYVPVTGVSLSESSIQLNLDNHETATLTATISPANATNKEILWMSNDDSIATVSQNGVVTPVAIGETDISVITDDGDFDASCHVEVTGTQINTHTIGWGSASASDGSFTNFNATSGTINNLLSFSSQQNSGTNPPAVSSSQLRLYYNSSSGNGGSITITPTSSTTITGFTMIVEQSYNPTVKYYVNGGNGNQITTSGTTYTVSGISASTSLKIQNANTTNKQLRIIKIALTYTQTPYLTSIEVENAPTKTSYTVGDFFDPTGLVIRRNYSNNSHDTYSYAEHTSAFSFTPSLTTPLTVSDTSVSITYSECETSQSITVVKGPVTGITASVNKTYYVGQSIVKSDISVVDSNGDPVTDFTFDSYQFTYEDAASGGSLTDKQLSVTYLTFAGDFTAKVQRKAYQSTVGDEDVLTRATTGVASGSTTYSSWSNKKCDSKAVYAGNSAGDNDSIQLRSKESNSGIITTSSGGNIKKVSVVWNGTTSDERTLNVYGKNTAYSAASDLYGSNSGTLLGTIVKGTSTELEVSGDYSFVGVRSNSGAMYLTSITFSYGGSETPDNVANYIMYEDTEGQCEDVGQTKGKFSISSGYFENLSKEDRSTFMTSNDYVISTARARFIDWAKHHHKTIVYSGDDYVITPSIQQGMLSTLGENQPSIIVIVAVVLGTTSLGGYIFIRRKKFR